MGVGGGVCFDWGAGGWLKGGVGGTKKTHKK